MRREWSGFRAVAVPLFVLAVTAPAAFAQDFSVTLLGTGSPRANLERFGPSILVQAGDQTLIFDAGRGSIQRLSQIGVGFNQVDALFLTHLHSDHVVGIPDLWLSGWLLSRRAEPLTVFGPNGTSAMMERLRQASEFDIRLRIEDDGVPQSGSELNLNDIEQGVVYEAEGVRVTAFEVDHRPIVPAFGYRIDYEGHSVVLSGDTRYSPNLIEFAEQADLLVHEVADASNAFLADNPNFQQVLAHHTLPQDAGRVFEGVQPKLAVYSHIVVSDITNSDLVSRTRETYTGPLVVGEDLMTFEVGDDVAVYRP